ncbi:alpha/beta fold hydrolase [Dactylosporangium sp. CA-092794]|uniref:alpha/beta fold hydrolase n=1 Tax=Dactylosporangium sp. CA-092794 TaxID=3239929 RepID=UPI003D9213C9
MITERRGVATARDGAELAYTIHTPDGAGNGPRLALVHSLGLTGDVWRPVVAALGDTVALTYDCRGHGRSARLPGPYTLDTFADDLGDVLDAVGWSRVSVGGASMGGMVAQAFAVRHPARVGGLALVDTTAWYGPDAPQRWEARARAVEENGLPSVVEFQLSRWFTDELRARDPAGTRRWVDDLLAGDAGCYAAACRMMGGADLRAAVEGIAVDTAVVVGEHDYATPLAMAEDLHARIGRSTLHVIPGVRHLSLIEAPDLVAHAIRRMYQPQCS